MLRLLATTQSDDFVAAGAKKGYATYEVIERIMAEQDRYLFLKALQVAYALGIKSGGRVMNKHCNSADYVIREAAECVRPMRKRKKEE